LFIVYKKNKKNKEKRKAKNINKELMKIKWNINKIMIIQVVVDMLLT
jgi:hypothetical protein